jgi:16S rRNA pseudouridine516 synthase
MRLDRLISQKSNLSNRLLREKIARGDVRVDNKIIFSVSYEVDHFSKIEMDQVILQDNAAIYLMLNKPAGYLSATTDPNHPTVIDLINESYTQSLHIAGRLDRASTGLILLTNDGNWSKSLTEPEKKIPKTYKVELQHKVNENYAEIFAEGIYFAYEDITTRPVELRILGSHNVEMILYEGRYHQIKRMFHAVNNKVVNLHRSKIGKYAIGALQSGAYTRIQP